MTQKEAEQLIKQKVKEAEALISEAESLADEHNVGFSWDLAYGMGGWYEPNLPDISYQDALKIIETDGDVSEGILEKIKYALKYCKDESQWDWSTSGGWNSSSSSC